MANYLHALINAGEHKFEVASLIEMRWHWMIKRLPSAVFAVPPGAPGPDPVATFPADPCVAAR